MSRVMFLTPPEIQHQTLKEGRGYDRAEVDKLLEHVTSSYEQVWLERDELRSRLSDLEGEIGRLQEQERLLSNTLVTAQRVADELRTEAQRVADETRAEAEREAQRIKLEALSDLGQQKAEAERELDDLRAQIDRSRDQERELRANLRAYLEGALRQLEDGAAPAPTTQEAPLGTLVEALAPDADATRVERQDR
jgi:cell division initiation protein